MAAELKPYPAHRDSGVEWLGRVPAHWETLRLKSSVRNVVEQTTERLQAGGLGLIIALENVESWSGRVKTVESDSSYDSQLKQFARGDVLFGKLRPYLAKVARLPTAGLCVGEFLVLRPSRGDLVGQYLEYFLRSKPVIDAINSSTFGAKMPRADWQFMGGMLIVRPPLPEQAAIVRFLDHADRRIRRYIRAKEKLITLLEEQNKIIIQRIVTGRIDVRTGQSFRTYRPSGLEWPGEVPAHWEVVPFKRRVGFQEGPGIMAADFRESGVPLLRISCLREEVATLSNCNYLDPDMVRKRWGHFAVREGDYLLSASASTGAVSLATGEVIGAIPYTGIIRLWARSERTVMEYVRLFLESRLFQDQIDLAKSGVGIEHFGPTHLGRMVLVLPSVLEQDALVCVFREAIAPLASRIAVAHREIELLREYRTRLFADVSTGKLDVREAAATLAQVDSLGADGDAEREG